MPRLRNIERTLDTLKRLDPEHYQEVMRAIGARGNHQPHISKTKDEREGNGKTKRAHR